MAPKFGFGPNEGDEGDEGDEADNSENSGSGNSDQPFGLTPPDMQALMAQFESMGINPETIFSQLSQLSQMSQMSQASGAMGFNPLTGNANNSTSLVPLETIREIGRQFIAAQSQLPVGTVDLTQSSTALDLADLWLNDATIFPALTRHPSSAWSRREWLEASVEGWQKLVEPLANGMAGALGSIVAQSESSDQLDEAESEINNPLNSLPAMLPILRSVMDTLFATQLGNSVGALALTVTGSNDVALPLFKSFNAHLIPQNAIGWGEGLDIPEDEIRLFLALRECAAARLFAHTPWLSQYIYDAVSSYATGIRIDIQTMQEQAESAMNTGELDLNNPQSIQIAINQGLFTPEQTPKQEAALARLEIALALIEGWIDHVTTTAASERLPSYAALSETLRRRRATSAPTQQLFSMLFGLEVSPRKSRECTKFWSDVKNIGGLELRDGRWEDPALLPTTEEISDAAKFLESTTVPDDLSGLI